jgi:O-antigen/teichoic acid export membrane protein
MGKISTNIIQLFLSDILPSFLTYIFLIISSNYSSLDIIGIVGVLISTSMIFSSISNFEIGVGVKSYLGKYASENNWLGYKQITFVSSSFIILSSLVTILILSNPFFNLVSIFGIEQKFFVIISIMIVGLNIQHILRGVLTSHLKSKAVMISMVIGSLSRFPLLVYYLNSNELNELNISWSYSLFHIISSVILIGYTILLLYKIKGSPLTNYIKNLKIIFKASIVRWFPSIIGTLGTRLGILAVFASGTSSEAGIYFIPYALFGALMLVSSSTTQITHPVFSGLSEKRLQEDLLKKIMKISFIVSTPIAAIMIFYARPILEIFGKDFGLGENIFIILLVGFPLLIFSESVYYLFYSRGEYRNILYLGLFSNIPRIILYFFLVPLEGGIGAAIAFTIGSIFQTIFTIILIKKKKINLEFVKILKIIFIPVFLGILLYLMKIDVYGSLIIFFVSHIIFLKLKIITEDDVSELITSCFSESNSIKNKVLNILKQLKLL